MAFCPQCGTQIDAFPCGACGANPHGRPLPSNDTPPLPNIGNHADQDANPQEASSRPPKVRLVLDRNRLQSTDGAEAEPTVYRRMRVMAGELVLTHKDLTLYASGGSEIIKSNSIHNLVSAKSKNGRLIVTIAFNMERNYTEFERKLNIGIAELEDKKQRQGLGRIDQIRLNIKENTIIDNNENAEILHKAKLYHGDKRRDTYVMSPDIADPASEGKIWVHAINRLAEGIKKIDIITAPPNALILVDGKPRGVSPCVIPKPLTDQSALCGKHEIEARLEGHQPKRTWANAKPNARDVYIDLDLERNGHANKQFDENVASERKKLQDGTSIGYSESDIQSEYIGTKYKMAILPDRIILANQVSGHVYRSIRYIDLHYVYIRKGFLSMKKRHHLAFYYRDGSRTSRMQSFHLDLNKYPNDHVNRQHYKSLLYLLSKRSVAAGGWLRYGKFA